MMLYVDQRKAYDSVIYINKPLPKVTHVNVLEEVKAKCIPAVEAGRPGAHVEYRDLFQLKLASPVSCSVNTLNGMEWGYSSM